MNRTIFQHLAQIRLDDARSLLQAGRYDGAYYLSGYAVECALKACIAKLVRQYDFPDKNTVVKSYSHNLVDLAGIAGLKPTLENEAANRTVLGTNWLIVKDWDEHSRYTTWTQQDAEAMFLAIADQSDGVFQWLTQRW